MNATSISNACTLELHIDPREQLGDVLTPPFSVKLEEVHIDPEWGDAFFHVVESSEPGLIQSFGVEMKERLFDLINRLVVSSLGSDSRCTA